MTKRGHYFDKKESFHNKRCPFTIKREAFILKRDRFYDKWGHGWRQGKARGGYSSPRSMLAPRRKVKRDFFGDFWHL